MANNDMRLSNKTSSLQLYSLFIWFRFLTGKTIEGFNHSSNDSLCSSSLALPPSMAGKIRLFATDLLNLLPYAIYRPTTTVIKQIRGVKGINQPVSLHPSDSLVAAYSSIANTVPRSTHVCLTHDIDTKRCYELLPGVLDIEAQYGVHSCCNFLTEGPYSISNSYLDKIENSGCEIGLHGDFHDLAIGFRDMLEVKERLLRSLDKLGRSISGFRAPGLGISEPLLQLLSELGFSYDSSIKLSCFYTAGTTMCFPYLYPQTKIWELPLALQDDGLFRDLKLGVDDALKTTLRIINLLKEWNGLFVLNTHPVNLDNKLCYYKSLLSDLTQDDAVKIILPCDLVKSLKLKE